MISASVPSHPVGADQDEAGDFDQRYCEDERDKTHAEACPFPGARLFVQQGGARAGPNRGDFVP